MPAEGNHAGETRQAGHTGRQATCGGAGQDNGLKPGDGALELPADESLFALVQEALLLRRRALELELGGCRQRIESIERRYGLPRAELAVAVATGAIHVPAAEARLWLAELLRAQRLQADIDRLSQLRLIRTASTLSAADVHEPSPDGSHHESSRGNSGSDNTEDVTPQPTLRITPPELPTTKRRRQAIHRGRASLKPHPVGETLRPAA